MYDVRFCLLIVFVFVFVHVHVHVLLKHIDLVLDTIGHWSGPNKAFLVLVHAHIAVCVSISVRQDIRNKLMSYEL